MTNQTNEKENEIILLKEKIQNLELEISQLKNNKYKTKEYKYLYEDKLCPPYYEPSKEEISLAKSRYVFENVIWDTVYYLELYINTLNGKELTFPFTKDNVEKQAKKLLMNWNNSLKNWDDDNDLWDCLVDQEWFNAVYIFGLSDYHSGDCTAFASGCSRCQAESIFKTPNTANWSKEEGARMEKEFMADFKAKKELTNK